MKAASSLPASSASVRSPEVVVTVNSTGTPIRRAISRARSTVTPRGAPSGPRATKNSVAAGAATTPKRSLPVGVSSILTASPAFSGAPLQAPRASTAGSIHPRSLISPPQLVYTASYCEAPPVRAGSCARAARSDQLEHQQRAPGDFVGMPEVERRALRQVGHVGVEQQRPLRAVGRLGQL